MFQADCCPSSRVFQPMCSLCFQEQYWVEEDVCCICLDNPPYTNFVVLDPCKHEIHAECARKLLEKKCPLCRVPIEQFNLRKWDLKFQYNPTHDLKSWSWSLHFWDKNMDPCLICGCNPSTKTKCWLFTVYDKNECE